jgi:hypothetical protein
VPASSRGCASSPSHGRAAQPPVSLPGSLSACPHAGPLVMIGGCQGYESQPHEPASGFVACRSPHTVALPSAGRPARRHRAGTRRLLAPHRALPSPVDLKRSRSRRSDVANHLSDMLPESVGGTRPTPRYTPRRVKSRCGYGAQRTLRSARRACERSHPCPTSTAAHRLRAPTGRERGRLRPWIGRVPVPGPLSTNFSRQRM